MKKTTSSKQLGANRRNAQKSSGPKTPEGRAVSKMNALKHGILSKEVLVCGLNINESNREFSGLHERFWQDLNPVGPVEEMLVDQIVTAQWRLRRALKAESGEIALSVRGGPPERSKNPRLDLLWLKWHAFGDTISRMEDSIWGNEVLEMSLGQVRNAVERDGELTAAAIQEFVKCFGGKPNRLTEALEEFRLQLQQNPAGLEAAALRERNKHRALAYLDSELRRLSEWKADYEKWQKNYDKWQTNVEEARQAAAVLPPMQVLEKILRYETKLERQMYRAMSQLERVQRMRQGEDVPPPMTMEVSERP